MPPRHLALFLSGLAGGGAQRRLLILAHEFALRGYRVDVVAARSEGPFRRELSPLVRLVALDSLPTRTAALTGSKGLWVLASAPALARYLRRERPDLVLSTSNPANLAALCARRLARLDIPVCISVNVHLSEAAGPGRPLWGRWLRRFMQRWYPRADAAVAISQGVAHDLARLTRLPRTRISVIPNPVPLDRLRERASEPPPHTWCKPGAPPLVLAVGKLEPQKDFATLIRAFARVRAARPARLAILGEGSERQRLRALARKLGVESDVHLAGFVDNPFVWMAHASVFVLSSAWEGFSNALCEALACGCPVVSTDCPSGPAEILQGGLYGPLVPVGDHQAMAGAVLGVLGTPPARERLRARAAFYSVDRAVTRYLAVLERVQRRASIVEPPAAVSAQDAWWNRADPGADGVVLPGSPERTGHIALFIYALTGGGAQRRTLSLANALSARGHRVDLVLVRGRGPLLRRVSEDVRVIALDLGWSRMLRTVTRVTGHRGVQTAVGVFGLARYLRAERPDVLLSAANHVHLVAVWARRLARIPIPVVLRASNYPSANMRLWPLARRALRQTLQWFARRAYRAAARVIAVSHGVADNVAQLTGVERQRIATIYNPVDVNEVRTKAAMPVEHPWLRPGSPPLILGVGRLVPQKDFATLIRAFARVRSTRPARLVILGEGPMRKRLESLAEALGVAPDVDLPGYVHNPYAWMARASVFVLSSAWEGLPGVLLEALTCGCPVVSTNCPSGPAEILAEGAYGPLVPVGDAGAMAQAIAGLLDAPPESRWLYERVGAYSLSTVVDRYLEVLLTTAGLVRPRAAHERG
ncbi:MAG: glycosyltransferase [Gammaproteobacteria bacterium]|nr:glycosyltransferase [Gammaproteobacteria bacterium]NIR81634.1 glycosyltransferase [Gammaproteobacteria bacterium]NIR88185.1 glycosyltransferase [Gammaproteobacteria bacterium]NIU02746.1 glycosyltransferase [Gammaproteobacteria bacterium]NIV73345.1 glycosyltransferase [Gammaproteobacteria bacterium]